MSPPWAPTSIVFEGVYCHCLILCCHHCWLVHAGVLHVCHVCWAAKRLFHPRHRHMRWWRPWQRQRTITRNLLPSIKYELISPSIKQTADIAVNTTNSVIAVVQCGFKTFKMLSPLVFFNRRFFFYRRGYKKRSLSPWLLNLSPPIRFFHLINE